MGGNGEALLLHTVYKKLNFYYKSRKCPYQVLQVTLKNLYQYYNPRENPCQYYKSCENLYQVLQVTHASAKHAMWFVW